MSLCDRWLKNISSLLLLYHNLRWGWLASKLRAGMVLGRKDTFITLRQRFFKQWCATIAEGSEYVVSHRHPCDYRFAIFYLISLEKTNPHFDGCVSEWVTYSIDEVCLNTRV